MPPRSAPRPPPLRAPLRRQRGTSGPSRGARMRCSGRRGATAAARDASTPAVIRSCVGARDGPRCESRRDGRYSAVVHDDRRQVVLRAHVVRRDRVAELAQAVAGGGGGGGGSSNELWWWRVVAAAAGARMAAWCPHTRTTHWRARVRLALCPTLDRAASACPIPTGAHLSPSRGKRTGSVAFRASR
eukprot:4757763-Prymnesium_polylepis.1